MKRNTKIEFYIGVKEKKRHTTSSGIKAKYTGFKCWLKMLKTLQDLVQYDFKESQESWNMHYGRELPLLCTFEISQIFPQRGEKSKK